MWVLFIFQGNGSALKGHQVVFMEGQVGSDIVKAFEGHYGKDSASLYWYVEETSQQKCLNKAKSMWLIPAGSSLEETLGRSYTKVYALGSYTAPIAEAAASGDQGGAHCVRCGLFYTYVNPNRPDGTYVCPMH